MFNIIEKNQGFVKGVMIVVTASFILWGIGSYLNMVGNDTYVAKVGNKRIYSQEIDSFMQQNKQYTDKLQALYVLINRQLILNNASYYYLTATDQQLQKEIASIPDFQESGLFSLSKYKEYLNNNKQTTNQFQNNVQEKIVINQFFDVFKNSYFSSNTFNNELIKVLSQERNVSSYTIDPKKFYSKINLTDKQISDYYHQNINQFTNPEKVKVQYITLSPANIESSITISESQLNQYIITHNSELSNTQVNVSHILFSIPESADEKTKQIVKEKATKVLEQVKAHPKDFAKLAKSYSEDPGSAKNGGELGYFGRGAMVPEFEKSAFNLKPNEISNLVETKFGYHILRLNSKKSATNDEIKTAAIKALRKQQSISVVAQKIDLLNDLTYNKPNSLEPAAKALGISIKTSPWISKNDQHEFSESKVQKAIFSDEVLKKHNNSEVVDLGNNTFAVYRMEDYKKSFTESLVNVKNTIINELKQQQAIQLANKEAQEFLVKLNQHKLNLNFSNGESVNLLSQNPNVDPMAVRQIFNTAINRLPAYSIGVNQQKQVIIYRINKEGLSNTLIEQNKKVLEQFDARNAMLNFGAYLSSLKSKFAVSYKTDKLSQNSDESL